MSAAMRIGVAGAGLIGRKRIELHDIDNLRFICLAEQFRRFLAVIAAREAPPISVQDAIGTLAVVEAVREAARTGTRVPPGQIMEQAA